MVTKHRRPESILLFVDKRLLRPVLPLHAYGHTPSLTGCDQRDQARETFLHAIMPPSTIYDNEYVQAKRELPLAIPFPGTRNTYSQQQHH